MPVPTDPSTDVVLGDIASSLRRIADALERALSPRSAHTLPSSPDAEVVDIRQLATLLAVSTRWVQRHLRPSFRASTRGKAFYRVADVEAQLAVAAPAKTARTTTRAKPKPITTTSTTVPRREAEADIAAVEARLRAAMTTPRRGKR